MKNSSIWQNDRDHFIHPYTDFATFKIQGSQVISKAAGNYVYDQQGNRYLDGIAGLWCVNIGHGRREMADEIHEQVMKMEYANPFGHTTNEPASLLAAKLAELAPGTLNHVFFTCGGSTANDSAIRIIHYYNNLRGKSHKKKIIARRDGYHGSTYISADLTGIAATKFGLDCVSGSWISHVSAANMYRRPGGAESLAEDQYADFLARELEAHILQLGADNVAAFIAEPVMGAGGVLVAPVGYHRKVWEVCKKHDVLYVADEVVTGFGRLGHWVASEPLFDYVPDVLIVAKGITSGYIPLGAAIFSDEIYRTISEPQCKDGVFTMGFTYTGHAVASAAALRNIDIMERENLLDNVRMLGPYFQDTARRNIQNEIVGDVRGKGFMLGIEMVESKDSKTPFPPKKWSARAVFEKCLKKGVIVRPIGNTIVLSPPLTLDKNELNFLVASVAEAIDEAAPELRR